jgi:hypothetical protein
VAKRFDSGVVVAVMRLSLTPRRMSTARVILPKGCTFVPLDLFSSGPTRSRAAIGWTPLTRDGGQQLGRKFGLYDMTSEE